MFFPEAPQLRHRQASEIIPPFSLGQCHGPPEEVGPHSDISVSKNEPLALGIAVGYVKGVRLAEPALGELTEMDDFEVVVMGGKLVEDLRCGIAGAVVDSNHLIARIVLGQLSGQSLRELGGLVAGGGEYRNLGVFAVGQRHDAGEPWDSGHAAKHAQAQGATEQSNYTKERDPEVIHILPNDSLPPISRCCSVVRPLRWKAERPFSTLRL